jgi:hypothetical protein
MTDDDSEKFKAAIASCGVKDAVSHLRTLMATAETAIAAYSRQCNDWRDEIIADEKRLQGYSRVEKDGLLSWDWLSAVARIQFNLTEEQAWGLSFDEFMDLWRARIDCDTRQHFAVEKLVARILDSRATPDTGKRSEGGGMGEGNTSIKSRDGGEALSNSGATELMRPSPDVSGIETAPPSTLQTAIESAPPIPTVVRDLRNSLIREYKRECRRAGVKVTDEMIAQAANKNWSDRTMVAKFKDCTAKDVAVDLIMRVLREKPHLKK